MPSSRYQHSSIGSRPSASFSMTSMDDPPPPPPPRRNKGGSKSSSRHRDLGASFDTSMPSVQTEDAPQSRYEDENDSRNSRDFSHTSSRSSPKIRSSGRRTSNKRDKAVRSVPSSDFSYQSNGSQSHVSFSAPPPPPPGAPPQRSRRDGLGRISEDDTFSRDSRSTKSSRRSSTNKSSKSREAERKKKYASDLDAESVNTEVLRFGGDEESNTGSKGSVAERRRKKAQAKSKAFGSSPAVKKIEKKVNDSAFDDPPLELYSESESDDSDYAADKAGAKKAKNADGITRVKSLIQMGKSSPESKNKKTSPTRSIKSTTSRRSSVKKNQSPSNKNGKKSLSVKNKTPEKKKKGGFLSRFSPGRKRGEKSPERSRGREKSKQDPTGRKSPFRFRSRSRSKSHADDGSKSKENKSKDRGETVKKHSNEIVVDKEKLSKLDKKLKSNETRVPPQNDDKSRSSAKSRRSRTEMDNRSRHSHQKSSASSVTDQSGKKETTFEKLRREREEKSAKEKEEKNNFEENSNMEIISESQSDDVSDMTDPTYMTKREEKGKSPVNHLEPVTELYQSSPESSPKNRGRSMEEDDLDQTYSPDSHGKSPRRKYDASRNVSPTSTRSKSRSVSPTSTKSKSRSPSPTSRSPRSREYLHEKSPRSSSHDANEEESRSESPTSAGARSRGTKHSEFSKEYHDDSPHGDSRPHPEGNDVDEWDPKSFTGKENFVATIDPFQKAQTSKDPFDEPFYPNSAPSMDDPKEMYSFVYSESDAELERGGFSKDTLTGISFDSEDEDLNNADGISFATKSDTTEVIQNSLVANQIRSKRQMLPPGEKMQSVRNAFLGIDENSGAVTLNVSQESDRVKDQRPVISHSGSFSQRVLQRPKKSSPKKSRGFLEHTDSEFARIGQTDIDIPNEKPVVEKTSPVKKMSSASAYSQKLDEARSRSKSPDRVLSSSPSFINGRRERKIQEALSRHTRLSPKAKLDNLRGKADPVVAQERGRRREEIFEKAAGNNTSARTFSPEKMKYALKSVRDGSPTRTLARSRIRSPQQRSKKSPSRTPRGWNAPRRGDEDSWFERPEFSTEHLRSPASTLTPQSSTRSVFKAPAVFGQSPREARFKAPEPYNRRTDPVLASVAHIQDPIQRAGAMILSAAAIPIQTEMRRYLAVRHREDRTWAIVVVQSYFRRWRAELHRYKELYCVTRIQAAFRGWLVRDTLEDKHYCATQIQKVARGYLATMSVYEDLYNITVIQSIARRNAAIRLASQRHSSIVTIQSLWRGLQCKRELSYLHWSATKVQSAWRGYTAKLNYQFDIVDIIIVQSIARRRAAIKLSNSMRSAKFNNAATTIQKYWRSYDCTMNYLHCVADVLIVQSVVRRWGAKRFVQDYREALHYEMSMRIQMCVRSWLSKTRVKKQRAARDIQRTWRGFWCYTDYVFTLADIIVVQKTVRGYQARKRTAVMADERQKKKKYDGAVMIQKTWRGYSAQMEMLFNLVHIIIVQSVVRRRIEQTKFKARILEHRAAIKVQNSWNTYVRKREFMRNFCATVIQVTVRRRQANVLRQKMTAARTIQAWYRCQATCRGYTYYMSARKIQTAWRGYDARNLANEERWVREFAAISIQKTWRRFYQYSSYAIYKHEKKAATDIQRHWRGFWDFSHFVIMRFEACKIQAIVRGVQQRKRLHQQNVAAVIIQAAIRGLLSKKQCHMERLFRAMVYSAQMALSQRIAARKIQDAFRDYIRRTKEKKAALVIERFFIWVRGEVEREIERRARQRIRKKQQLRKEKKQKEEALLEKAYKAASKNTNTSRSRSGSQMKKNLQESMNPSRRSASSRSKRLADLALDIDDEASDVSGLTTPTTATTPKFKLKNKGRHDKIDDDLEGAWREAKRKQGLKGFDSRPRTRESQKENSSTYTPNFKLSARSLSRTREKMHAR